MVLGEVFLAAFLQVLFDRLASRHLLSFARLSGVQKELEKWYDMLIAIQAVLYDAEEKQLTDKAIRKWLDGVRDLAFDVEDMLDEFAAEAIRCRLNRPITVQVQNFLPTCFVKFNLRMASKIKGITSRLDNISKQRFQLGLEKISAVTSTRVWHRPPSTSMPAESHVYGRNEDREKMLDLLFMNEPSDVSFHVIPIVGMGGVGKTTLAQVIYNDNVVRCFDSKAWVCVAEEFDVLRITKAVLESVTSLSFDSKDFNQIQVKLKDALAGKMFLIVLDDVWNKNYGEWNRLQAPFRAGAAGSKIVVTTRDSNVALMMGATKIHYLEQISDDDCWSVFAQHAFENKDISAQPNLERIGRKIVKKCKGLPLAARTLGGILRCKQAEEEWEDVLNSQLWSLPEEECEILPVLRLSYYHLPSHLKRCFAFCSVLPKDYEFEEMDPVLLWMAEGLIQQDEENKQIEDLGSQYFHELFSRSLFQQSSRDNSKFVMHDLISDLALWVAGGVCFVLEDKMNSSKKSKFYAKARYSAYRCSRYDDAKKFGAFSEMKGLRTFLPFSPHYHGKCYLTNYVPFDLLPKLRYLRILSFSRYNITKLPDSICELKHLRYLNLCHTNIRSLPESTSSLYGLQTLLLRDCACLRYFPFNMGNLINLRHLDFTNGGSVKKMPSGIKKLTNLRTLSNFIVGKGKGSSLKELMELNFLCGTLCISKLQNVTDARDARDANLKNKELDVLFLKWDSEFDDSRNARIEKDVLDMLQPNTKLKQLIIQHYGGTKFPIWLGDPSFSYLTFIRLENCEKCTSLPPFGLIPSLKDLHIIGMPGIKSVGPEFYGVSFSNPFPSLQTLCFRSMKEWEVWIPYGDNHEELLCLRELWVESCPKLTAKLPSYLPSLEKFIILECEQLAVLIPSFPVLCELQIKGCKEVVDGGVVKFSSPNSVLFSTISELTCLSEGFLRGLRNVEELKIFCCEGLTSMWQNNAGLYQCLISLRSLVIKDCSRLVSLVAEEDQEQLKEGWVSELQYLEIRQCESLVMLPQCLHSLVSLKELVIEACPRLISLSANGLPPMLRVIRIKNCSALAPLPSALICNSTCLESLYFEGCELLMSFARSQLPSTLKRLEIRSCKNLQYLLSDGESSSSLMMQEQNICTSTLEYLCICDCPSLMYLSSRGELPAALLHLQIRNCPRLTSLSAGGNLPARLRNLSIENCPKLEIVAERFQVEMSLETINILSCESLNSLPASLHNLTHLHEILIEDCPSLVSFPGELPSTNMREIYISWCENLKALPDYLHNLTSLEELWIYDCPGIVSFPEEGFPTKLTSLTITNLNICKPLFEWGLQRLNSLRDLYIEDGCFDVLSFPEDETRMMLPNSLKRLEIKKFPNLGYLSTRGFQNLSSLEYLSISYCRKLSSFPKNGLPPSLLQLYIFGCPLLKKYCKKNNGREWFKIANVPCVRIDGSFIHDRKRQKSNLLTGSSSILQKLQIVSKVGGSQLQQIW